MLLCGRFEGFDARVEALFATGSLSIGPYVLAGGEVAALAVVEAVIRHLPGSLGNTDSVLEESFSEGLGGMVEYPHYTRPREYGGSGSAAGPAERGPWGDRALAAGERSSVAVGTAVGGSQSRADEHRRDARAPESDGRRNGAATSGAARTAAASAGRPSRRRAARARGPRRRSAAPWGW